MAKKKSKTTSDDPIKKQNQPAQTDKAQPEKKKSKTLSDELLEKYLEYAQSEEAFAVLFVKKYLNAADGKWIDILETHSDEEPRKLEFLSLKCELFQRKILPQYPPKSEYYVPGFFDKDEHYHPGYFDELKYITACRAITWDTAHEDIDQQRAKNIQGAVFLIEGKYVQMPNPNYRKGFFIDTAPIEIKALANNLDDRSDPLWEKAKHYINYTRDLELFPVFDIKKIQCLKKPNTNQKNAKTSKNPTKN